MLKRIFHTLWLLSVALLFLVAVVLTAARLWVPALSEYRLEIERAASEVLKKDVSIGRLEATFRGLNPVLKLKHVVLADPAGIQDSLAIREVWITIDADQYLAEQQLRHEQIVADMEGIAAEREAWVNAFLERIQTRGFNYNCDALRQIGPDELPEQPARPFKVVY